MYTTIWDSSNTAQSHKEKRMNRKYIIDIGNGIDMIDVPNTDRLISRERLSENSRKFKKLIREWSLSRMYDSEQIEIMREIVDLADEINDYWYKCEEYTVNMQEELAGNWEVAEESILDALTNYK